MKKKVRSVIAYFVSAHGLGHAARAAAVMAAVHREAPVVRFEIFTTVPRWFFDDCLTGPFACHLLETDVGLAQTSPLEENLPATIEALDAFYPLDESLVRSVATNVNDLGCRMVICDIAPLGIAVARQAGLPSVLVENFTWDWIYAGYTEYVQRLAPHIAYLQGLFKAATYHVQTVPVCAPGDPDVTVAPVSRPPRLSIDRTRRQLVVPDGSKLVVLTLGGTATSPGRLNRDNLPNDVFLVVPGSSGAIERTDSTLQLPLRNGIYHPDLIRAADAVIGKTGYSTLAEIYHSDVPFGYVSRTGFREAPVLEDFTREKLPSLEVSASSLHDGSWSALISTLVDLPVSGENRPNGADEVANFLFS
ncbi:MAG: hypothetical protein GY697_09760 [Desulfobacterales bacterium]|nr:hypothetical protein [Desulfobacterales bacterium]